MASKRFIVTFAWPKGAARADRVESNVTLCAETAQGARAIAEKGAPEHDLIAVTEAQLQPDGRWTFPRD